MNNDPGEAQGTPLMLKQAFDKKYESRGIVLPREYLANRCNGSAYRDYWTVHYAFNRDETGEYLAVLDDHPLAYACLIRIDADGRSTLLANEPQFGETREMFDQDCRDFNKLIGGQGLPTSWR